MTSMNHTRPPSEVYRSWSNMLSTRPVRDTYEQRRLSSAVQCPRLQHYSWPVDTKEVCSLFLMVWMKCQVIDTSSIVLRQSRILCMIQRGELVSSYLPAGTSTLLSS